MIGKIEAIIFDMDGVLVDSEPHHMEIEKKLFRKYDLQVSDKEHQSYMGMAGNEMWENLNHNHQAGLDVPEMVRLNYLECNNHFSLMEKIEPMPGLLPLLEAIQKADVPMALASSAGIETIAIILEKTGLRNYFSHVVSGSMVEKSKPEPDVFLYTARLLQTAPQQCLVIEDSVNGVKAAKAAGMFCVAYSGSPASPAEIPLADVQIKHFNELERMLKTHRILMN